MPDVFEPPDETTTDRVASRRWGDGDQPTRAEAKVGLTIAAALLALYAMWVSAPWQADSGIDDPTGSGSGDACASFDIEGGCAERPTFIDENGQLVEP